MAIAIRPTILMQARILLVYTGSQRTFISQQLKSKLQLKPCRKEVLHVNTFGTTESTSSDYEVVALSLKAEREVIKLKELVCPIICVPFTQNTQLDRIPNEFRSLKIADSVTEEDDQSVEILIGNGNYAQYNDRKNEEIRRQKMDGN